MADVEVKIPEKILATAKIKKARASQEIRKLIALELFRENAVSMGKAAEIAGITLAEFMELSAKRGIPMHYTKEDLEEDRKTATKFGL